MIRRIVAKLNLIICLLAVIFVGTIWARSWFHIDAALCTTYHRRIDADLGSVIWDTNEFSIHTTRAGGGGISVNLKWLTLFGRAGDFADHANRLMEGTHFYIGVPDFVQQSHDTLMGQYMDYGVAKAGFGYYNKTAANATLSCRLVGAAVPCWVLLFASAILPTVRLYRWNRKRRTAKRQPPRLCPICSYDLRAHLSGQKCPECGTLIPWPKSVTILQAESGDSVPPAG